MKYTNIAYKVLSASVVCSALGVFGVGLTTVVYHWWYLPQHPEIERWALIDIGSWCDFLFTRVGMAFWIPTAILLVVSLVLLCLPVWLCDDNGEEGPC